VVLDLGSAEGSFDEALFPDLACIRVDLEPRPGQSKHFVQADVARLPFRAQIADAVICNHSLEHFTALELSVQEIGRVIKPTGALFVSIPDCSTITDRLYRWLARGGGHVNQVDDPSGLIRTIESATDLPHCATRLLCTSLSFLNSRNPRAHVTNGLSNLGNTEPALALITWLMRKLDKIFGTRTGVYGWAFYFGQVKEPIDARVWSNLCVRCGSAHSSEYLRTTNRVLGAVLRRYVCPTCGAINLFTEDEPAPVTTGS
jgi:hypothetical protein